MVKSVQERTTIKEILELSDRATLKEAQRNYKRLIKEYHPDISKSEYALAYTKKLNWAIEAIKKIMPEPRRVDKKHQTGIIITIVRADTNIEWSDFEEIIINY